LHNAKSYLQKKIRSVYRSSLCMVLGWIVLFGCAGAAPEPTRVFRSGDLDLSCDLIAREAEQAFSSLGLKENQKASDSSKNLTFWILGQIAIVPMLGIDVSGAAEVEQKAMFRRVERLRALSERKEC
jgi:hypothetical protein